MKIKLATIISLLIVFSCVACNKNKNTHCWVIVDVYYGSEVGTVCGETEEYMRSKYPNPCNYYKEGETKYCWYTSDGAFIKDKPESYIATLQQCLRFSSVSKVPCEYCQTWYSKQKKIYKPANSVTYSVVTVQRLCGDTVRTLYNGREIPVRESTDSLITIQFGNTPNF